MILCVLPALLIAQTDPKGPAPAGEILSEPLGQEISETQRSIHALEAELARQHKYLDDLYTVQDKRERAKSDQVLRMEALQHQINALTRMMGELTTSVQTLAEKDTVIATVTAKPRKRTQIYTRQDSLELLDLKRRETESREQIDRLTQEILEISQKLKDPDKRYALAKKLQERGSEPVPGPISDEKPEIQIETISARSIDLAAVDLVREGKSLDQARMMVIDALADDQVLRYYQELPREERYNLYDIADEIMSKEGIDLLNARRSALFFHFYTP